MTAPVPNAAHGADGAPDPAFSRATLVSLRRVLHAHRPSTAAAQADRARAGRARQLPEGRLATSACLVAADARRRGLSAARMLVALKAEWHALPEVRRLAMLDAWGPAELLDRLVTLSIGAYYATADAPEAGGGGRGGPHTRARLQVRSAA